MNSGRAVKLMPTDNLALSTARPYPGIPSSAVWLLYTALPLLPLTQSFLKAPSFVATVYCFF